MPAPSAAPVRADARTWIAVIGSVLGAFMAVLNIQITNASLAQIQGGIGAGIDDGGWVVTAYLIGEIIVIPLTDFMSRVFSLRRYMIANVVLFLLFSVLCGNASTLGQMVVLRAIQGFCGGVLIPLAFTIVVTRLPKAQQPVGLALFALTATFAPAIGPTIGGFLTDNYGWKYIFYLNLVPGAVMLSALTYALDPSPMRLDLLKGGDWLGMATMSVGLGCLQTVLEEGNKNDWYGSAFITRMSLVAGIALVLFVLIELRSDRPLIKLSLIGNRNFAFGLLANTLLGFALYGSGLVLTLYLSQTQAYNSEQVGSVMAWTGLPQLILIPFVPWLMKRIDIRALVVGGLGLFAGSFLLNIHLSGSYGHDQLLIPNIVRACGQALVMTPLSVLAMASISVFDAGAASGLFNMTRNLGGAFGTAILQTFLTRREQFHSAMINSDVSVFQSATRSRIEALQRTFQTHGLTDPQVAWQKAAEAVGHTIHAQATIMAFSDAFFLLGVLLLGALAATLCTRKVAAAGGAGGGH
jgi:DHA2 family multidrug resistance protein